MTDSKHTLGIGLIGYGFMGAAHSHAWRTAPRFFDLPLEPSLTALCGRDADGVEHAAEQMGWASTETDWRQLIARDDIDVIDICTPGHTHAEIAIAALDAGKHVMCEKPLATNVADAEAMVAAAERASARGIRSIVGFNYRRVPALALARRLVADGRLGEVRQVRAQYLQDWLADPTEPMSWRLDRVKAGSGALGDIGAHIVDLAQFIIGADIAGVAGLTETFTRQRPHHGPAAEAMGNVTVDDAVVFIARFANGAIGSFEASRVAAGRKNAIRLEISGTLGSLAFDFESMNELAYYDRADDTETAGFRRILTTDPSHPYADAWWPPGHGLGYEHTFTHQAADFIRSIGDGTDPTPTFRDGLQVQRVLGAVEASAAEGSGWVELRRI